MQRVRQQEEYPLTYLRVFGGRYDGQEFVIAGTDLPPEYIQGEDGKYWPRAETRYGVLIYVKEGMKWETLRF